MAASVTVAEIAAEVERVMKLTLGVDEGVLSMEQLREMLGNKSLNYAKKVIRHGVASGQIKPIWVDAPDMFGRIMPRPRYQFVSK